MNPDRGCADHGAKNKKPQSGENRMVVVAAERLFGALPAQLEQNLRWTAGPLGRVACALDVEVTLSQ